MTPEEQYHALAFYTLAHPDRRFIHQHLVDAYAAQTADAATKPITVLFALAGLYLFLEMNYTGKQVQEAHMRMAKKPKEHGRISLPAHRGSITAQDVLAAAPGPERDEMIWQWCMAVWAAFADQRTEVIRLTEKLLAQ